MLPGPAESVPGPVMMNYTMKRAMFLASGGGKVGHLIVQMQ